MKTFDFFRVSNDGAPIELRVIILGGLISPFILLRKDYKRRKNVGR